MEPGADMEVDKRPLRLPTEKGALYHEYSQPLHFWLTHLRRVHHENPVGNVGSVAVKAADPLAPEGTPLYYYHSRTAYYNSFFLEYWDKCFAPTFKFLCPFYDYDSVGNLDKLLDAKFQR